MLGVRLLRELGNGGTYDSPTPVTVNGLTGVTSITMKTDAAHACALLVDGTVRCWGFNGFGQLGFGVGATVSVTAGTVTGLSGVIAITIGQYHSCALLADGTVACWGLVVKGHVAGVTAITAGSGFRVPYW